jgi:hypothetical protein
MLNKNERLIVISEQEYDVYWINDIITEDKLDDYIIYYRNKLEKEKNILITRIGKYDDSVSFFQIIDGLECCNYGFDYAHKEINSFYEDVK